MSVLITLDDVRAYAEVDYIINHMNIRYKEMVPEKMLKFFSEFRDPNHVVNINPYVPLDKQGLQRYTLEIIALLHLKYWCENEERKKELYDIMLRNQQKLDAQMKDRFSIENLFENTTLEKNEEQDYSTPRVVQKFEQYTESNDEIEDYTDVEDVVKEDNLPAENSNEQIGFFQKIKKFFASIFGNKS